MLIWGFEVEHGSVVSAVTVFLAIMGRVEDAIDIHLIETMTTRTSVKIRDAM
jgi:hypothetical protein